MVLSSLMEAISKLWPFSQRLKLSDEGYFVSPQMNDSDLDLDTAFDDGEPTTAHNTAPVSTATFGGYVPGSCLTVCLSRLRSSHSSPPAGFQACQDNTILPPLRDTMATSSTSTIIPASQAELRRLLQSVLSRTVTPASTKCPATMSRVRLR